MLDAIPPSQLATFDEAALLRSFTAAACALNLRQPAAGRQVAALEARLGPRCVSAKNHASL